ncbi:hypothetical protein M0804_001405 [Polistes exclamans]|nr:hypothetical protein M0804_001405 [Polistes exclamans]
MALAALCHFSRWCSFLSVVVFTLQTRLPTCDALPVSRPLTLSSWQLLVGRWSALTQFVTAVAVINMLARFDSTVSSVCVLVVVVVLVFGI